MTTAPVTTLPVTTAPPTTTAPVTTTPPTTTDTTPTTTAAAPLQGDDNDRRAVRALYFGTYDRDHPRNLNAIAAMRTAGIDVVERSVARAGHGPARRAQRRVGGDAPALAEAARVRHRDRRLPGPLRRPASAPARRQAAARLRRGALARGRARRRAAPVSAALGCGDRAARRRHARAPAARPRRLRHPTSRPATSRRSGAKRARRCSSVRTRSSTARRGRRRIRSPRSTSPTPRPTSCERRRR